MSPESEVTIINNEENNTTSLNTWDGDDDPRNPRNWSTARKLSITFLVNFATLNDSLASTIFSPAVPQILQEFHIHSASLSSFLISVHVIGFAVGPLLCPVSEVYGRSPMMHASNMLFILSSVLCAVSTNVGMLIFAHILMGLAGCVPAVLGGRTLSVWACGSTFGSVIGPIAGGYLAQKAGWRWTFWLEVIVSGLTAIATIFILKETYAPVILHKTRHQNNPTQFQTNTQLLKIAIARPLKLLTRSPTILLSAFYTSTAYVYMYFLITIFPTFFSARYRFNEGEVGLTYLAPSIGLVLGQFIFGPFLDWYHTKQTRIRGYSLPEDRLTLLLPGNVFIATGLFWFEWSAQAHTHWAVPLASTIIINLGVFCVFTSILAYIADSFELLSASARAANAIVRSVLGAVLPLLAPRLYEGLGYGWGFTLLGLIVVGFMPTVVLFRRFGGRLRVDARFRVE
ncbi:polyamine transporter 1 [Aspergillus sclerotioniger CBS 115572]|uniref:Polyamine transporter 1 n=1 Tax=Aspergillus sclerotioniger CBS 115572 TaxID=1450535 RepID=A0A317VLP8_9EURO|nr:polyamine transporter 1 [Aspergillus sclerotioniger CBS 115572]PWY75293.1 polyamine transporter 1 [Aspergillus sclerotioniger CBS 115572]